MKFYNVNLDIASVLGYKAVQDMDGKDKKNKQGDQNYAVEVLVKDADGRHEVETLKFYSAHDPLLTAGSVPTVENLRLLYWTNGDRSGVSFLADSVATDAPSSYAKSSKKADDKVTV